MCRKALGMILTVIIFHGVWSGTALRSTAATESDKNILNCSNFEVVNAEGRPEPWSVSGTDWGAEKCGNVVTADDAPEGERYAVLQSTTATKEPIMLQSSVPIEPGATYEIAFWMRAESETKAAVKLEYYKTGVSGSVDYVSFNLSDTSGAWVEKTLEFTPSVDIQPNRVSFLFRLSAAGTVHWDNIRCEKVQEAPFSTITTDEKFYYTGAETGTATLTKTGLRTLSGDLTVDFALYDESEEELKSEKNISFSEEKIYFTFPVSTFELKKAYTVFYTVYNNGTEVESGSHRVYRYNRPHMIDENGKIYHPSDVLEDGSLAQDAAPFMPVMGYHVQTDNTEQYQYAADVGINVVQFFPWTKNAEKIQERLDLLAQYNLMAFVALYGNELEDAQTIVEASMHHDAVFGYMLMDEPFNNGTPLDTMERLYKAVRDVDDKHPTYLVESMSKKDKYSEIAKYADIFAVDPYPGSAEKAGTYPAYGVELAKTAVNGEKPVMCINQCFPLSGYEPTGEAVRNMTYQALMSGAAGIGYYDLRDTAGYNDGEAYHAWDRPCWQDMISFAENELDFAYKAFISGEHTKLSDVKTDTVWYQTYKMGESVRCIAINRTNAVQSVEIPVSGPYGSARILAGTEAAAPTFADGKITVSISPLGALVLEPLAGALVFLSGGKETDTLQSGTVTARYSIYSAEKREFTMYLALYKKGSFTELEMMQASEKCTVEAGETISVSLSVEVENPEDRHIKVFIWESGLCPADRIYTLGA